jgi:hypothetical protein
LPLKAARIKRYSRSLFYLTKKHPNCAIAFLPFSWWPGENGATLIFYVFWEFYPRTGIFYPFEPMFFYVFYDPPEARKFKPILLTDNYFSGES